MDNTFWAGFLLIHMLVTHVFVAMVASTATWAWLGILDEVVGKVESIAHEPSYVPEFLRNKLAHAGVKLQPPDRSASSSTTVPVRGLVSVRVGAAFDAASRGAWSREALFLQRAVYKGALDGYLLQIASSYFFPPWETELHICELQRKAHRWNENKRSGGIRLALSGKGRRLSHHIFLPQSWKLGEDESPTDINRLILDLSVSKAGAPDGQVQPVSSVLEPAEIASLDLSQCPCILLPNFLFQLVKTGLWKEVVALARWSHPEVPSLSQGLPEDWVRLNKGKSEQPRQPAILSERMAGLCSSLLRRATPHLLSEEMDEELAAGVQGEVDICINALESHALSMMPSRRGLRDQSNSRSAECLLAQVLAAMDLRNQGHFKRHAMKFLRCVPADLQEVLRVHFEKHGASQSAVVRGGLFLDLALLCEHRSRMARLGPVVRYAWGDATSKGGREIYNTRCRFIELSKVVELARGWRFLCLNPASDDQDSEQAEQRCVHSQALFDNVHLHTHVPQYLGQGRTTLLDKVSAHVHSTLLEAGTVSAMSDVLKSVVAWVTDMCVEAGLPNCHVSTPESTLPSFVRPSRLQVCPEDAEFVEEGFYEMQGEAASNAALMPAAIHLPGVCHAVHNASANLNSALSYFDDFLSKLRVVHKFLGSPSRRDRFVEVVLQRKPSYDVGKSLFKSFTKTLYEERWGEVASYLKSAQSLFTFLRLHWDEVAYVRDAGDADVASAEDNFTAGGLTALIKDGFFHAYWEMQLHIRLCLQRFLRWAEGCSCHPFADGTPRTRETKLRGEISCPREVSCTCPMMGCQAPFLVEGKLQSFREELLSTGFNDVVLNCHCQLTAVQWSDLEAEWKRGCQYLCENLKLRLAFFGKLPWSILGGCHPDPEVSRRLLAAARDAWNELPADSHELQHPVAKELFASSLMEEELGSYLSGESALEDLPLLETFLAKLTFVQVAERIIEGAHKEMGKVTNSKSPSALSIALRAPELNRRLSLSSTFFADLVEAFEKTRKIRKFREEFPAHAQHPDILSLDKKAQTSKFVSVVRHVLYRDPRHQHADLSTAKTNLQQGQKEQDRLAKPFAAAAPKAPEATIIARAVSAFVQESCEEDQSRVFSIGDMFFTPLVLRPSAIRRPRHAPGVQADVGRGDMLVSVLQHDAASEGPHSPFVSPLQPEAHKLNLETKVEEMGVSGFLEGFRSWQMSSSRHFTLPLPANVRVDASELSVLVTEMLDKDCLAGRSGILLRPSQEQTRLLQQCEACGVAEQSKGGWILSVEGIRKLQVSRRLEQPSLFGDGRGIPLQDCSLGQLLMRMRSEGMVLKYIVGEPRVWHSSVLNVNKNYLCCLLDAENLKHTHGTEWIPHAAPAKTYELLLSGVPSSEALQAALEDVAAKRKAPRLQVTDGDVEGDFAAAPVGKRARIALKDQVQDDPELGEDRPDEDKASICTEEIQEDLERLIAEADEVEGGVELGAEEGGAGAASSAAGPAGSAGAPAAPAPAARSSIESVPAVPAGAGIIDAASAANDLSSASLLAGTVARLQERSSAGYGAGFSFSRKQPHSAPPFGGVEATCRYHRKNTSTGCKKFIRLTGLSAEAEQECCVT
ncbi:unnamed protein product [Symbiodinium sp. CCMP2592]|nr:unnamed protein product [Symbiodinium sp. CCMP2592]